MEKLSPFQKLGTAGREGGSIGLPATAQLPTRKTILTAGPIATESVRSVLPKVPKTAGPGFENGWPVEKTRLSQASLLGFRLCRTERRIV